MPNQGNKSNGKSGIVQPKKRSTKAATPNTNQEPSGKKQDAASKRAGSGSGNSRNSASGSNTNE